MASNDIMALLANRTEAAAARLDAAIRIDFHRFVAVAVEQRLRNRPHFFARTPHRAFVWFRTYLEATADKAAERMAEPIRDLRIYYGASARSVDEQALGLAKLLSDIVDATRELISEFAFPGDQRPDRAEDTAMDLEAEYALEYSPSPGVLWAWQQVRELDEVRNQIADASGPPAISFELRYHLPELAESLAQSG